MKQKLFLLIISFCLIYLISVILFTDNFWISFFAIAFLPLSFSLLFNNNTINPLFFGLLLQWLSVCSDVFYCNLYGETLYTKYFYASEAYTSLANIELAYYLSLTGLYVLLFAIFLGSNKNHKRINSEINLDWISSSKLLNIYLIFFIVSFFGKIIVWYFAGLSQVLLCVINFRFGILAILFYLMKNNGKLRLKVWFLVVFEMI
jgi:hypothetical protein